MNTDDEKRSCPHCHQLMSSFTREERHKRRKDIADTVSISGELNETAEKFGCSVSTVYSSMREFGVPVPLRVAGCSMIQILAALLERESGATAASVAQDLGLTRQRVHHVYAEARRWGIDVPPLFEKHKNIPQNN